MTWPADDLHGDVLRWIWRAPDLLADSATPWAHGTIYRSARFPHHGDLNSIRVMGDPRMSVQQLVAFADREQAGLPHRRFGFDDAAVAEPLRAGFEAEGYMTARLLWMHFEGIRPESISEEVQEVADERVEGLRLEWQHEEHPGHDPRAYLAETNAVRRELGTRVLVVQRSGEPIGFAGLDLGEDEIELGHLYVRSPYRGRGLGTTLAQAAIAAADVPHLWICADDEGRPKELYARLGFRPVTTTTMVLKLNYTDYFLPSPASKCSWSSTKGGTMSSTKTRLRTLNLVCIPSPEQDAAIDFYEKLGFEKRTDTPFGGGYRWVEVYLPGDSHGIALAPPPPQDGEHKGVQTGVTVTTDDIDATHAEFKSLGVDVDDEVSRMGDPVPPMFWFRDPNGNTLMVVQPD